MPVHVQPLGETKKTEWEGRGVRWGMAIAQRVEFAELGTLSF